MSIKQEKDNQFQIYDEPLSEKDIAELKVRDSELYFEPTGAYEAYSLVKPLNENINTFLLSLKSIKKGVEELLPNYSWYYTSSITLVAEYYDFISPFLTRFSNFISGMIALDPSYELAFQLLVLDNGEIDPEVLKGSVEEIKNNYSQYKFLKDYSEKTGIDVPYSTFSELAENNPELYKKVSDYLVCSSFCAANGWDFNENNNYTSISDFSDAQREEYFKWMYMQNYNVGTDGNYVTLLDKYGYTNMGEFAAGINKLENQLSDMRNNMIDLCFPSEEVALLRMLFDIHNDGGVCYDFEDYVKTHPFTYKYTDENGKVNYFSEFELDALSDSEKANTEAVYFLDYYGATDLYLEIKKGFDENAGFASYLIESGSDSNLYKKLDDGAKKWEEAIKELEQQITEMENERRFQQAIYDNISEQATHYSNNIWPSVNKDDFEEKSLDIHGIDIYNKVDGYMGDIVIMYPGNDDETLEPEGRLYINNPEAMMNCIYTDMFCGDTFYFDHYFGGNVYYYDSDGNKVNVVCDDPLFNNFIAWNQYMTEEEKAVFRYKWNTEGYAGAYDWLNGLSDIMDDRWVAEQTKNDIEFAKDNPVIASLYSWIFTPFEGMSAITYSLETWLTEEDLKQTYTYSSGNVQRAGVAELVNEKFGEGWAFVYNTGMSIADSLLLTVATMGVGSVGGVGAKAISGLLSLELMGSRTYVSTLNDALDRGLSDDDAILLAFSATAVETISESISTGKLIQLEPRLNNVLGNVLSNIDDPLTYKLTKLLGGAAIQGLSEADEEFVSSVLNFLCDDLISGDLSSFKLSIEEKMSLGYSEDEAISMAMSECGDELLMSYIGGLVSGGFNGGLFGVAGQIGEDFNYYDISKNVVQQFNDSTFEYDTKALRMFLRKGDYTGALNQIINLPDIDLSSRIVVANALLNDISSSTELDASQYEQLQDIVNVGINEFSNLDLDTQIFQFNNLSDSQQISLLNSIGSGSVSLFSSLDLETQLEIFDKLDLNTRLEILSQLDVESRNNILPDGVDFQQYLLNNRSAIIDSRLNESNAKIDSLMIKIKKVLELSNDSVIDTIIVKNIDSFLVKMLDDPGKIQLFRDRYVSRVGDANIALYDALISELKNEINNRYGLVNFDSTVREVMENNSEYSNLTFDQVSSMLLLFNNIRINLQNELSERTNLVGKESVDLETDDGSYELKEGESLGDKIGLQFFGNSSDTTVSGGGVNVDSELLKLYEFIKSMGNIDTLLTIDPSIIEAGIKSGLISNKQLEETFKGLTYEKVSSILKDSNIQVGTVCKFLDILYKYNESLYETSINDVISYYKTLSKDDALTWIPKIYTKDQFIDIAQHLGYTKDVVQMYLDQIDSDLDWDLWKTVKKYNEIYESDPSIFYASTKIPLDDWKNASEQKDKYNLVKKYENPVLRNSKLVKSMCTSLDTLRQTLIRENNGTYDISANDVVKARMEAKKGKYVDSKKVVFKSGDYTAYFPKADYFISDAHLYKITVEMLGLSKDTISSYCDSKGYKYGSDLEALGMYLKDKKPRVKGTIYQTATMGENNIIKFGSIGKGAQLYEFTDSDGKTKIKELSFDKISGNYYYWDNVNKVNVVVLESQITKTFNTSGGAYTLLSSDETMAKNFPDCCELRAGKLVITDMKKFGEIALSGVPLSSVDGAYKITYHVPISECSIPSVNNGSMYTNEGVPGGYLASLELETVVTATDIRKYLIETGNKDTPYLWNGDFSDVVDGKEFTVEKIMEVSSSSSISDNADGIVGKMIKMFDSKTLAGYIEDGTISKGQVKDVLSDLLGSKFDNLNLSDDSAYNLYINLLNVSNNAGLSISDLNSLDGLLYSMLEIAKAFDGASIKIDGSNLSVNYDFVIDSSKKINYFFGSITNNGVKYSEIGKFLAYVDAELAKLASSKDWRTINKIKKAVYSSTEIREYQVMKEFQNRHPEIDVSTMSFEQIKLSYYTEIEQITVEEYSSKIASNIDSKLTGHVNAIIESQMKYIQLLINNGKISGDVTVYDVLRMLTDGVDPKNFVDASVLSEWNSEMNPTKSDIKYNLKYAENTGIGTSGKGLRLSDIDPKALPYLEEDPNAVFGYRIVGNGRFASFDFSNVSEVMKNREIRVQYLLEDEAIQEHVAIMQSEGYSVREMAEYAVNKRNQNKVNARANMKLDERTKVAMGNVVTYGCSLDKASKEVIMKQFDDIYLKVVDSFEIQGDVEITDDMIYNKCIEVVSTMVGISPEKGLKVAIGPDLDWCFESKKVKLGPNVSDDYVYWQIIIGSSKANQELNAVLGLKQ